MECNEYNKVTDLLFPLDLINFLLHSDQMLFCVATRMLIYCGCVGRRHSEGASG
jgi:hypothetical protein